MLVALYVRFLQYFHDKTISTVFSKAPDFPIQKAEKRQFLYIKLLWASFEQES